MRLRPIAVRSLVRSWGWSCGDGSGGEAVSGPKITWRLTWPNEPPKPGFATLDGERVVGRVYQYPHGPQQGLWFWTMTISLPGPRFLGPISGVEEKRGDAGRRVVEAYHALLAHVAQAMAGRG